MAYKSAIDLLKESFGFLQNSQIPKPIRNVMTARSDEAASVAARDTTPEMFQEGAGRSMIDTLFGTTEEAASRRANIPEQALSSFKERALKMNLPPNFRGPGYSNLPATGGGGRAVKQNINISEERKKALGTGEYSLIGRAVSQAARLKEGAGELIDRMNPIHLPKLDIPLRESDLTRNSTSGGFVPLPRNDFNARMNRLDYENPLVPRQGGEITPEVIATAAKKRQSDQQSLVAKAMAEGGEENLQQAQTWANQHLGKLPSNQQFANVKEGAGMGDVLLDAANRGVGEAGLTQIARGESTAGLGSGAMHTTGSGFSFMESNSAMGLIGATGMTSAMGAGVSYATGGDVGEGAMMGAMGGFGIGAAHRAIKTQGKALQETFEKGIFKKLNAQDNKSGQAFLKQESIKDAKGLSGGKMYNEEFRKGASEHLGVIDKGMMSMTGHRGAQTFQTRNLMMGGAGLSGFLFGGKRKDHSRGMNSTRGNRL